MSLQTAATLIEDLVDLRPDTISVQTVSSRDVHNQPTFATASTQSVYVEGKTRIVRNTQGDEVTSSVTIYGSTGLTVHDKITLPSRFSPQSPEIINIERRTDEFGAVVDVVYL